MKKSILSFVAMLVVIALLGLIVTFGVDFGIFSIPAITDTDNGIKLGLDLVGGSIITFEAMVEGDIDAKTLDEDMNAVESMLRGRLDGLKLYEATLYRVGDRRITVEIPSITDPEQAVQDLGSTAQLEFKDSDGNVVLTGADIQKSVADYKVIDNSGIAKNHIVLTIKAESVSKFTEATKVAAGKGEGKNYIDITMDGESISRPSVESKYAAEGITGSEVVISGSFTAESAGYTANLIAAGQLPFALKDVELRSVGPQLGMKALESSIVAGLIGLALVMVFMIVCYRLPGLVASIALCIYTCIVLVILSAFRVNLSLPGIAGIILSIGMAVDANVIIFERIKEELRRGKTIKASIDAGFDRAFAAILDSNVTTMIAAIVLYFFGTGTIVGFALTLGIGIVVSMFTALTVTRFLLNCMVDFKIRNIKFYGVSEKEVA